MTELTLAFEPELDPRLEAELARPRRGGQFKDVDKARFVAAVRLNPSTRSRDRPSINAEVLDDPLLRWEQQQIAADNRRAALARARVRNRDLALRERRQFIAGVLAKVTALHRLSSRAVAEWLRRRHGGEPVMRHVELRTLRRDVAAARKLATTVRN